MSEQPPVMSDAFRTFMSEAPAHAGAWMRAVRGLDDANGLDKKTEELAYLAVLAALRLESGMPLHVRLAKEAGATREEVISAVLVGQPQPGQSARQVFPTPKARSTAGLGVATDGDGGLGLRQVPNR